MSDEGRANGLAPQQTRGCVGGCHLPSSQSLRQWTNSQNSTAPKDTTITTPRNSPLFLKVFPPALEALASDEALTAYYRLHLLVLARAQPNGHAEFARGALAKLVGKAGNRHHDLESAIQQAVKRNLLHQSSMPNCLVLPTGLAEPWDKSGKARFLFCRTHTGTPKPLRTADCHPDRRHKAHGHCDSCYRSAIRLAKAMGCEPPWASPSGPAHAAKVGEIGGEFAA